MPPLVQVSDVPLPTHPVGRGKEHNRSPGPVGYEVHPDRDLVAFGPVAGPARGLDVVEHVFPTAVDGDDVVDLEAVGCEMVGVVVDVAAADRAGWLVGGDDGPKASSEGFVTAHQNGGESGFSSVTVSGLMSSTA